MYQQNIPRKVKESPYPLLAGIVGIIALTIWGGVNYPRLLQNIWAYVYSFGSILPEAESGIPAIATGIAALILIDLSVCFLSGIIVKIAAKPMKHPHKIEEFVHKIGISVSSIFVIILLEELLARALFMGLFAKIFPGGMFFWGIIGNTIWALIHFRNYHKEDRHLIRVLPQFVSGLIYMFIYSQFGFLWTLIAHFSFNAMLFAMYKRNNGLKDDFIYGLYWLAVSIVGGYFFFKDASALLIVKEWLAGNFAKIEGAGFIDYFLVIVAIGAFSELLLSVLGYDANGISKKQSFRLIDYLFGAVILVGLIFLGLLIGNFFGAAPLSTVLVITVILTIMAKVDTVSALSRIWFDGLISNFLLVSAAVTLGFWAMMLLFLLYFPILILPMIIRRKIGKFSYNE